MIAILKTACGCERAINVPYHFPRELHVPLYRPLDFIVHSDYDPEPAVLSPTRRFDFYSRHDDGILEYREHV